MPGLVLQGADRLLYRPGEVPGLHDLRQEVPGRGDRGGKNRIHVIDQEKCTKCGTCFEVCPPRFRCGERRFPASRCRPLFPKKRER